MGFKKVFEGNGETFSARYEAEKWLSDNGYSVGSSSVDGPQGVVKGDVFISKWRNMSSQEQKDLDGYLSAGREGAATLTLKEVPNEAA